MRISLIFIVPFLFLNLFFPINGSEFLFVPFLRLQSLIDEVIKRNPNLAAVRARVKAAAIAVPRVQTLDDPIFTIRFLNNPFGSKKEFVSQRRYRLSQKIPFIGKLRLRGEIAQHILEFNENEEITTYRDLILQTKRLYYQLFFNKAARYINQENRNTVGRLINDTTALYAVGSGSQDDVLKAQIELEMLDNELLLLISEQETLISMINVLMDRSQSYPIGESEEFFSASMKLDYELLVSVAMRERSELHGIIAQVEEEEAIAALARRDYYPDFTFSLMLQNIPDKQTAWGVDISFNLPIWIGQKQKREVEEAEARALANSSQLNNLRAQISGRIRELLAKIKASEERIALYETSLVPKTVETLATNKASYVVGNEHFLTVLDTRRQLQNVQLEYEQARVEREILLAELEWEIGVPLNQPLQRTPIIRFDRGKKLKKKKEKTLAQRIRKPNKRSYQTRKRAVGTRQRDSQWLYKGHTRKRMRRRSNRK